MADIDPYDPAQAAALSAAARELIAARMVADSIPARFADAWLAGVAQVHGAAIAEPLIGWCREPGAGLVLLGPTGTGKSYTAAAVLRSLIPDLLGPADVPLFLSAAALLAALRPNDDDPDGRVGLRFIVARSVLVIDDVGAERLTDWALEQINAIIDGRWLHARPTIITSNLSASDLAAHLGPRCWSRLTGSGSLVLRLSGTDLRKDHP